MVAFYLVLILAIGTLGYHALTPLSWLDSLYYTVSTISTGDLGGRELAALDRAGKLFTMALIVMGTGLLAYTISAAVEVLVDDHARTSIQRLFVIRRTRRMQSHYIVCGLGRVGVAVCEELAAAKTPFLVIDQSPERVRYAACRGWLAVLGDATEDETLEEAGIARARGLIACAATDTVNLFVVVSARALNPEAVLSARVSDDQNVKKFERAGATHISSPYALAGRRIARSATRPRVVELLDLVLEQTHDELTIEECVLGDGTPLAGVTLQDSGIRQQYGGVVLCIVREDHEIVHNPAPDTLFQPRDILITLGSPARLRHMRSAIE